MINNQKNNLLQFNKYIVYLTYLIFFTFLINNKLYAAPVCDIPVGQFCVNYYDNTTLSDTPILRNYEASVNHIWEHSGPRQTAEENQFSGRWQGQFDFQTEVSMIFQYMQTMVSEFGLMDN